MQQKVEMSVILVNIPQKVGINVILANMQRKVDISVMLARNSLFSSQFPTLLTSTRLGSQLLPNPHYCAKLISTHTFYPSCAEFIIIPTFYPSSAYFALISTL